MKPIWSATELSPTSQVKLNIVESKVAVRKQDESNEHFIQATGDSPQLSSTPSRVSLRRLLGESRFFGGFGWPVAVDEERRNFAVSGHQGVGVSGVVDGVEQSQMISLSLGGRRSESVVI